MERATVKEVLRKFNEAGVRYCLVGGLALAHHSIPRQTQDVDIMVLPEDLPLVKELLAGHQLRGTAVVMIFQIGDTRFDVIPAILRAKRTSVLGAIEDAFEGLTVKVANLRDMILLKMWAATERPERSKHLQEEADVIALIEFNPDKISAEDIGYVSRNLLALAYTPEDADKFRAQVEWLNSELLKLGLINLCYPIK
jgi:predicted nucleotidyltransferase